MQTILLITFVNTKPNTTNKNISINVDLPVTSGVKTLLINAEIPVVGLVSCPDTANAVATKNSKWYGIPLSIASPISIKFSPSFLIVSCIAIIIKTKLPTNPRLFKACVKNQVFGR